MKVSLLFFLLTSLAFAQEDAFVKEAQSLAKDLKMSLMKNLSEKISKDGPVEAVSFCHANVKPIALGAAKERLAKYEFGRTSHKVRNAMNAPKEWALQYLKEFQGTNKSENSRPYILHTLQDSKRVYLEPLYVEAKCLLCHGENVDKKIKDKVQTLYPQDKATGFKLGEFRGFIWVKEK